MIGINPGLGSGFAVRGDQDDYIFRPKRPSCDVVRFPVLACSYEETNS